MSFQGKTFRTARFVVPIVLSIRFVWMIFIYCYYHAHPDERCGGHYSAL